GAAATRPRRVRPRGAGGAGDGRPAGVRIEPLRAAQGLWRQPSPPARPDLDDPAVGLPVAVGCAGTAVADRRPSARLARADRLSAGGVPRGTRRRREPKIGAGGDFCRNPGAGEIGAARIASGPAVRAGLSAQHRPAEGRMSGQGEQLRLLEALLFAAPEPLSEEELGLRLGEEADVEALLRELAELYAERGINLVALAGGWTFRTAPDLASALRSERNVARRLSRAAVETLAVIAYHQPVTRAEIEAIRGVTLARGTLDRLLEAGWVQPKGRRETPGRPLNWTTTPHFLAHFGLDS